MKQDKRIFIVFLVLAIIFIGFLVFRHLQNPGATIGLVSRAETFSGVLPCADCSGLNESITLLPDHTYQITDIYQGKNDDDPFVTKGTWQNETGTPSNPNQLVLALTDESGNISYYAWTDADTITSIDQDKNPINAPFNLSLTRVK